MRAGREICVPDSPLGYGHRQSLGGCRREVRQSTSMAEEVGRLQVDEVRDGFEGRVEPFVGQNDGERWLDVDHCVPCPDLVQVGEDQIRVGDEQVDEVRIELRSALFDGDGPRLRDASDAVSDLDELRELREPRGDRHGVTPEVAMPPFAVPLLVRGRERVEHRLGQTELFAQPASHLRMVGDHVVEIAMPRDRELQPDAEPGEEWMSRAELSHPGGRTAETAYPMAVLDRLHRDVVAEPLGLLVGIRVAADVDEQRRVVHDRAFGLVETDPLREPKRDQALPKDVLHRLPEAEVDTEREGGDQFRQPELRAMGLDGHSARVYKSRLSGPGGFLLRGTDLARRVTISRRRGSTGARPGRPWARRGRCYASSNIGSSYRATSGAPPAPT